MKLRDALVLLLVAGGLVAYSHPAWLQSAEQWLMNQETAESGPAPSVPLSGSSQAVAHSTTGAPQVKMVRYVSIFDSPAMPDVGGHSIIGGLLSGKGLTAVLPNLKVCARPKTTVGGRVCTAVCKPGHQCLNQPFARGGLILPPSETAVVADVWDIDGRGTQQIIASFEVDVAKCGADNHCKFGVVDEAKYGNDAVVEISFGPVSEPKGSPSTTDPTQTASGPSFPPQNQCGDMTQGTFFDHSAAKQPLYTDNNVDVWTGVSGYQNGSVVGGTATDGITFTAKACSATPHVVQFVARKFVLSDDQLLPGWYLTSDQVNPQNFAMEYPNTTDINNPAWHVDARTLNPANGQLTSPYYEDGKGAGWCRAGNQLTTFDQPSVDAGGYTLTQLQALNAQNQTNLSLKQVQPFFKTFVVCGDTPIAEFGWHVTAGRNGRRAYWLDSVFNRDPNTLQSELNGLYLVSSQSPNPGRRVPIN